MGISKSHTHPRQPLHLRRVQLHVIGVAGKILKGTGIAHPPVPYTQLTQTTPPSV